MNFYYEKIYPWFGIAPFIVIGVLMIYDPTMFDNVNIGGRKKFIKLIFSYIWGIPAGVISLAIGAFFGYKQLKNK